MRDLLARKSFPELEDLERLIRGFGDACRSRVVATVQDGEKSYPIYSVSLGSPDPSAPAIGFFGGVHGLEKIGSEVVLSYMQTLLELMRWDRHFKERLKHSRLVFVPIVNPAGVVNRTRSNANGVDLMRNSPLESDDIKSGFWRGHRKTPMLPYYRGPLGAEMEVEAKALMRVVEEELLSSRISLAVDVHSGFGAKDRFWFPYAHTKKPFPLVAETFALKSLFDQSYPHHFYAIEPVSRQYTIHGDLWDYIFESNRQKPGAGFFLPFTLEMGSWQWLKKNPLQVFRRDGVFHPTLPHRRHRILRRHLSLFDFLHRSILSPEAWAHLLESQKNQYLNQAMELWYG